MEVRRALGVAVGLVIASGIFLTVIQIATIFPFSPPVNIEYWTAQERSAYFSSMPLGANLTNIFGCLLAAIAGGWVTAMVSKERDKWLLPLMVGVLLTLIGVVAFGVVEAGLPLWAFALSLVMFIPFSLVGYRLRHFSL